MGPGQGRWCEAWRRGWGRGWCRGWGEVGIGVKGRVGPAVGARATAGPWTRIGARVGDRAGGRARVQVWAEDGAEAGTRVVAGVKLNVGQCLGRGMVLGPWLA